MSDECDLMETVSIELKTVLENQECNIYVTMPYLCIKLQFTLEVS